MSELGNKLKETRELKGISLDDLQEITKIQKRYLVAIEEGNYSIIPGKFYVRAFIKQYAEAVGIPPEQLFEEFTSDIPSVYEEEPVEILSRTRTRSNVSERSSKLFDILPKILLTVFIIGIVAVVWFLAQKYFLDNNTVQNPKQNPQDEVEFGESGNPPVENKNDAGTNENDGKTESPEEDDDPIDEPEPEPQKIAVIDNYTYELQNADRFELAISVAEGGRTWIRIRNETGQDITPAGGVTITGDNPQTFDLTEETTVSIRIGNFGQTKIAINGEELVPASQDNTQTITIRVAKGEE